MRRVLRWAGDGLTALSLALCLAAVGLRAASGSALRVAEWAPSPQEEHDLSAGPGGLAYVHLVATGTGVLGGDPARIGRWTFRTHAASGDPAGDPDLPRRLGFAHATGTWTFSIPPESDDPAVPRPPPDRLTRTVTVAPHWAAVAGPAALPAARLAAGAGRRLRRARRAARGRCPACAYDLTGNASGVCPECGAAAAAKETP